MIMIDLFWSSIKYERKRKKTKTKTKMKEKFKFNMFSTQLTDGFVTLDTYIHVYIRWMTGRKKTYL